MYDNMVPYLYDRITDEDYESILKKIALERTEADMCGVEPIKKYNIEEKLFECLNRDETIKILRDLKEMPLRTPVKEAPKKIIGIIHKDKRGKYYPDWNE